MTDPPSSCLCLYLFGVQEFTVFGHSRLNRATRWGIIFKCLTTQCLELHLLVCMVSEAFLTAATYASHRPSLYHLTGFPRSQASSEICQPRHQEKPIEILTNKELNFGDNLLLSTSTCKHFDVCGRGRSNPSNAPWPPTPPFFSQRVPQHVNIWTYGSQGIRTNHLVIVILPLPPPGMLLYGTVRMVQ